MLHPSRVSSEFGLNALYDSVNGRGDVWINENCFHIPFKRYVEIRRVAQINYGKEYGRLVVIVDVIDHNRALVDAPDMVRSQVNFKRLSLTDIKIDIKRVPKKKDQVREEFMGQKLIVRKRRASLNDFDRFKIMLAKIKNKAKDNDSDDNVDFVAGNVKVITTKEV
ncbi:hypothetical protein JHK82_044361 [Glycine max]|nr:hypothetical protein JHK86_044711 [Glycine max]KAG4951454.1 hypothetical protein JHK85_045321 [Glycine max]KAG5099309.1 hypothetical protein JHK82_044361 [Glycine max]KAG5107912.1 hypothetical protein JHK84_044819 [Glycine max]